MQNLYNKIIQNPKELQWSDFYTSFSTKHSQRDKDYALIAGTSLDTAQSESVMLQKWMAPWLWQKVLLGGLFVAAVLIAIILFMILVEGGNRFNAINLLFVMFLPCVIPFALMVFFWEMNVPRNISLMKLLRYFLLGGILALFSTTIFYYIIPVPGYSAVWAPVTEEPAKLAISLFFLYQLKKQGKVYGLNGLVIGAAVGAGFASFESAQYVYNYMYPVKVGAKHVVATLTMNSIGFTTALEISFVRSISAVCTHVLYCAPYSCAAALNMEKESNLGNILLRKNFVTAFLISCAMHALWNSGIFFPKADSFIGYFVATIIAVAFSSVVLWWSCLKAVRSSFEQLVNKIPIHSGPSQVLTNLKLQCISGIHAGVSFVITKKEITVGTDASCNLAYPMTVSTVDKMHCKLIVQNGGLYLADLGSRYGTFLNNNKLKLGTGYLLNKGDVFYIGSPEQKFVVM